MTKANRFYRILFLLTVSIAGLLLLISCTSWNSGKTAKPAAQAGTPAPKALNPGEVELLGIVSDNGYDFAGEPGNNYGGAVGKGYEYLQVTVRINTGEAGKYYISSRLFTENSDLISLGSTTAGAGIIYATEFKSVELKAGINEIPLYFRASRIAELKAGGPYKLSLKIGPEGKTAVAEAEYTTSKHKHEEFRE